MNLNVLDCKTDERVVTSALCYVEHGKIVCFGLHFCFPSATITQYVAWMERQFNACQTPRSMYLSIFNHFRVIRCLSPNIAIFTTFWFPLGTPLGQSCEMLYGWKENSMLTNRLAACTIYLQQSPSYLNCKCKKSPFSHTAAHIFVSPGDASATITHMLHQWKDNSMLAKPLVACTYLSSIVSELYDA